MGTVVTKLGGTIQPATQRRLVTVLVSALQVRDSCHGGMEGIRWHPSRKPFTHQSPQPAPPQGRTWTGKECLLRSLSDLAVSGPDLLAIHAHAPRRTCQFIRDAVEVEVIRVGGGHGRALQNRGSGGCHFCCWGKASTNRRQARRRASGCLGAARDDILG